MAHGLAVAVPLDHFALERLRTRQAQATQDESLVDRSLDVVVLSETHGPSRLPFEIVSELRFVPANRPFMVSAGHLAVANHGVETQAQP